MTPKEIKCKPV